jgi:hypothetical protein
MAAYYVHVLPFSMMSEKLEIGFFHGKTLEFCFIPYACMLGAICLGKRRVFFLCSNIMERLGCEI